MVRGRHGRRQTTIGRKPLAANYLDRNRRSIAATALWRNAVSRVVLVNLALTRVVDLRWTLMKKLFILIGTTIGSGIGWWLGQKIGIMTAFALSMVGTGLGMYYGIRFARDYE